jgi:Membrane glycosyltransferase
VIQVSAGVRTRQRFVCLALVFLTTLGAVWLLTVSFQRDGISPLELILIILYGMLFSWICIAFWQATIGFFICLMARDRLAITASAGSGVLNTDTDTPHKTAIIMPIHNEDAQHVFAGLRAVYQSLAETGQLEQFDLYALSDTHDPEIWIEEELCWNSLCQELNGNGRLFYRHRQENSGCKSGNIADFCKRWGGHYRYMIVLDADSVMAGSTLVELVRLMNCNPQVAIIQVPPVPVNRESLFARIQQFASSVYSRIFTAGLNFWQLSQGNYWGHNAIIRIEPFIKHCGLPRLPGREPFGGEILSHDFVEAALLHRAGWEVWLAYDLGGSYEEIPPTLIDYAKRDRRWCQGDLQHLQLAFARGFPPVSRAHLLMGVLGYLTSPLWLLFLVVTGIEAFVISQTEPVYFFGDNLFPVWPISYTVELTTVLAVTLAMLFLPKLLGLVLLFRESSALKAYGGPLRVILSVIFESLFSMLLAPILMLFQTRFVVAILLRRNVSWSEQQRSDHQTGVKEALSAHAGQSMLGIVAGTIAYVYVPGFFWWFVPVALGLVLAIPLSVLSSSRHLGRRARRAGLFLTPEETRSPSVLKLLHDGLKGDDEALISSSSRKGGRFMQAIVEPSVNALHVALLPVPANSRRHRYAHEGLVYKLLDEGPDSLTPTEKREILSDRTTMLRLHTLVWSQVPEEHLEGASAVTA